MNEPKVDIYEAGGGDLAIWVNAGGAICIKFCSEFNDPVELAEHEALNLANLLIRLVKEQHE